MTQRWVNLSGPMVISNQPGVPSAWLTAGVDIRTVAEYLGHGDPGFTLRTYAHLMPDAADRARAAMDTFFDPMGKIENPSALHVPSED
ncbi:MAG: phage integrase family protein [Actinomycetia bacterium]|nr:phage integrase family protein [Actinomycetes bacterium]